MLDAKISPPKKVNPRSSAPEVDSQTGSRSFALEVDLKPEAQEH